MRKDGAQVWVRIEAIVVPGSGEEALCRAMLSSISERKQAEQEYKTILQTAIDGFWWRTQKDGSWRSMPPTAR